MLSATPCNLLCSFLAKVQNDKVLLSLQVDFFAVAMPCKPLGCFLSKAQNDKIDFCFDLCLQVAWLLLKTASNGNLRFLQKLKTTKGSSPCRPRQVGFVSLNPNSL